MPDKGKASKWRQVDVSSLVVIPGGIALHETSWHNLQAVMIGQRIIHNQTGWIERVIRLSSHLVAQEFCAILQNENA
jgi:hypothetical protein